MVGCSLVVEAICFFFFKQKTAYEWRISDWSSDVCSSDLAADGVPTQTMLTSLQQMASALSMVALSRPACLADLNRSSRPGSMIGAKIGRASCRERVCQSV